MWNNQPNPMEGFNFLSPNMTQNLMSGGMQIPAPVGELSFNSSGIDPLKMAGVGGNVPWWNNENILGWGKLGLGALQGLGGAFMGMKQYGIAKKTLKENKRQFEKNYQAQRKTTNAALEDRQRARIASNPDAYRSVGDYMKEYGI